MFYEIQPEEQKKNYKLMLETIGNLTLLFSESESPYLPYRCHENIFCKYFEATNLGRLDCSAEAYELGTKKESTVQLEEQRIAI